MKQNHHEREEIHNDWYGYCRKKGGEKKRDGGRKEEKEGRVKNNNCG